MNLLTGGGRTSAAATISTLSVSLLLLVCSSATTSQAQQLKTESYTFGFPFNSSYYDKFAVLDSASINNQALQITPDSAGNFSMINRSGRIFFNQPFTLWQQNTTTNTNTSSNTTSSNRLASFNTTILLNIYRLNQTSTPGEGVAFLISPLPSPPPTNSTAEYLGLTNSTTDGDRSNRLLAVEFDTTRNPSVSDPDDNHVGLNINSVKSNRTASLTPLNITLAPNDTVFHKIWIRYDGINRTLSVYIAELLNNRYQSVSVPTTPVLAVDDLDISDIVDQNSYFGFSASTGPDTQELHCVLSWNITVEVLNDGGGGGGGSGLKVGVKVGIAAAAAVAAVGLGVAAGWWWWCWRRRGGGDGRSASALSDKNILGALKSLPGMPKEYNFKELKKATGNFDEKNNKLGQGGYGVVFKGFLACENVEVAVKRFSRDDIKSKDDFLAELTIINRLRHRHLVKLLGWCHKNGMLLLVYEYLPNGSLDKHIFINNSDKKEEDNITTTNNNNSNNICKPINWSLRYKILKGVASALHYLHHEYESTVIHRDLKASNIMLDHNFNARLGDFGLARALDQEKTSYAELEGVHGTMGYIAPECFHTGKATRESDIYGLGAVFLEVATGHRPWAKLAGYSSLVDYVWSLHRERRVLDAVDARLGKGEYAPEEAERVLLLGLACSHPMACERPKTQVIVQVLSGSVPVPEVPPFKPAFMWPAAGPVMGITSMSLESSRTADTTPIASSAYGGSEWTPRSEYDRQQDDGYHGDNDRSLL